MLDIGKIMLIHCLCIDLVLSLVYSIIMIVNIHDAKTHFSRLIKRAIAGEEITIAKNGKPLLKLVPIEEQDRERIPGLNKDKIDFSEDFSDPLPDEITEEFEQ